MNNEAELDQIREEIKESQNNEKRMQFYNLYCTRCHYYKGACCTFHGIEGEDWWYNLLHNCNAFERKNESNIFLGCRDCQFGERANRFELRGYGNHGHSRWNYDYIHCRLKKRIIAVVNRVFNKKFQHALFVEDIPRIRQSIKKKITDCDDYIGSHDVFRLTMAKFSLTNASYLIPPDNERKEPELEMDFATSGNFCFYPVKKLDEGLIICL